MRNMKTLGKGLLAFALALLIGVSFPAPAHADETGVSVTVEVTKQLTGDVPSKDAEFTFEIEPQDVSCPIPSKGLTVKVTGSGTVSFGDVTFTTAGRYYYRVWEHNDGVAGYTYDDIVYRLVADVQPDSSGKLQVQAFIYEDVPDADEKYEAMVFTNTYTAPKPDVPTTTTVTAHKNWLDAGSSATRPETVKFQLERKSGSDYVAVGSPVEVGAEDGWKHTWTGLSASAEYRVSEVDVPSGYVASAELVNGVWEITNRAHKDEPGKETVQVSVLKVWDDAGSEGKRPESVSFELQRKEADGTFTTVSTVKVTAADDWGHVWEGLDAAYSYRVVEVDVPEGYTSSTELVTNSEGDYTFKVTNTAKTDKPDTPDTPDVPTTPKTPGGKIVPAGDVTSVVAVAALAACAVAALVVAVVLRKKSRS